MKEQRAVYSTEGDNLQPFWMPGLAEMGNPIAHPCSENSQVHESLPGLTITLDLRLNIGHRGLGQRAVNPSHWGAAPLIWRPPEHTRVLLSKAGCPAGEWAVLTSCPHLLSKRVWTPLCTWGMGVPSPGPDTGEEGWVLALLPGWPGHRTWTGGQCGWAASFPSVAGAAGPWAQGRELSSPVRPRALNLSLLQCGAGTGTPDPTFQPAAQPQQANHRGKPCLHFSGASVPVT